MIVCKTFCCCHFCDCCGASCPSLIIDVVPKAQKVLGSRWGPADKGASSRTGLSSTCPMMFWKHRPVEKVAQLNMASDRSPSTFEHQSVTSFFPFLLLHVRRLHGNESKSAIFLSTFFFKASHPNARASGVPVPTPKVSDSTGRLRFFVSYTASLT